MSSLHIVNGVSGRLAGHGGTAGLGPPGAAGGAVDVLIQRQAALALVGGGVDVVLGVMGMPYHKVGLLELVHQLEHVGEVVGGGTAERDVAADENHLACLVLHQGYILPEPVDLPLGEAGVVAPGKAVALGRALLFGYDYVVHRHYVHVSPVEGIIHRPEVLAEGGRCIVVVQVVVGAILLEGVVVVVTYGLEEDDIVRSEAI